MSTDTGYPFVHISKTRLGLSHLIYFLLTHKKDRHIFEADSPTAWRYVRSFSDVAPKSFHSSQGGARHAPVVSRLWSNVPVHAGHRRASIHRAPLSVDRERRPRREVRESFKAPATLAEAPGRACRTRGTRVDRCSLLEGRA